MDLKEEQKIKRNKTRVKNEDKMKMQQQTLVKKIQEETKEFLLPAVREKMETVAKVIQEKVKDNNGLTVAQILPLIAKRSISDIASIQNKSYTAYELGEAFNIYIDMMAEINKVTKFPPDKGSFCLLLGISRSTYDNYLVDPDKRDIMSIIDTYITTSNATAAQLGEVKEIMTMFLLKSQHGFVEAKAPIVVEHKQTTDIDEINAQLDALKKDNIIEADYEEVSKNE